MSQGRTVHDFGSEYMDRPTRIENQAPRKGNRRRRGLRWCKGRVGTPHEWGEWSPKVHYIGYHLSPGEAPYYRLSHAVRNCTVCGKQDLFMPVGWIWDSVWVSVEAIDAAGGLND